MCTIKVTSIVLRIINAPFFERLRLKGESGRKQEKVVESNYTSGVINNLMA